LRADGLFRPPPAQDDIKYVKAEELISKITVDSLPASYYFPIVLFDWLKALTTHRRQQRRTVDWGDGPMG
jgi:hypothetical protein